MEGEYTQGKKYELVDSGDGEKLERFGAYILRRPDPEVLWHKAQSGGVWDDADATFVSAGLSKKWQKKEGMVEDWVAEVGGLQFKLDLGAFKHVGVFPEQVSQWEWMVGKVESRKSITSVKEDGTENKKIKILNLFGHTGGATCALARAGAEVTHVDAVESNITRTKENLGLNQLADAPVRLIVDDARKFVEREIRRGAHYDAILMDPPVYGKSDKKRTKKSEWRIEDDFLPLLARCAELLSDTPLFFCISGYASEYSHTAYANALTEALAGALGGRGVVESGELTLVESVTGRHLPAGIFARATF